MIVHDRSAKPGTKVFVLYDGRAKVGDQDNALVITTAPTEAEAREVGETTFKSYDAIWFECDVVEKDDGDFLENGTPRWDLPPARRIP
jgi:hypothetical protein